MLGDPSDAEALPSSLHEWLDTSVTRRIVGLLIGVVVAVSLGASGVLVIPGPVYDVLVAWLMIGAAVFVLVRERHVTAAVWRVHFAAQFADVAASLLLAHFLGATLWLAPIVLAIASSLGGQMVPRPSALVVAALGVVAYGWLLVAEVSGAWPSSGPFAVVSVKTVPEAITVAVIVAGALMSSATIQYGFLRRLASAERRHTRLLESASDVIVTLDLSGRFASANAGAERQLGWPREELIGRHFRDMVAASDLDRAVALFADVMHGRSVAAELAMNTRDGGTRPFHAIGAPVLGDDGRIVALLGIARDITDQRRAEEERDALRSRLEESRRIEAIGRLVSGVAHEINNPLTAILTFCEQLRTEARSPADAAALEAIYAQALRSRAVVRDLLAFAKPPRGRPLTALRLAPLIDAVVRSMRHHLTSLGVEYEVVLDEGDAWITGDAAAIEQLVTNVLLNAAEATAERGPLRVRTSATAERATIVIEDSGPGISAEAMPKLFEPFFTTKPVGEGVGLGLFVALGIARQHEGTIRACNRPASEGGGARFTIEIPCRPAPVVAPGAERPARISGPQQPPGRPRVLLIDDEAPIRVSLGRFFERIGWDVYEAADGIEGLALLRAAGGDGFAMILCDVRMPGMDGAELHARITAEMPAALERLVLTSGDITGEQSRTLIESSSCRVLEKPFELKALGALAEELLAEQAPSA